MSEDSRPRSTARRRRARNQQTTGRVGVEVVAEAARQGVVSRWGVRHVWTGAPWLCKRSMCSRNLKPGAKLLWANVFGSTRYRGGPLEERPPHDWCSPWTSAAATAPSEWLTTTAGSPMSCSSRSSSAAYSSSRDPPGWSRWTGRVTDVELPSPCRWLRRTVPCVNRGRTEQRDRTAAPNSHGEMRPPPPRTALRCHSSCAPCAPPTWPGQRSLPKVKTMLPTL